MSDVIPGRLKLINFNIENFLGYKPRQLTIGRFTLHNFCLKLSHATCLQLEFYRVNQAHNSLTTT